MLEGIDVFVHVVEAGGFSAAARKLGKSTSFVSKEVTRLEARLGARLLNRTTRSIGLTDSGRLYFEQCRQIVADAAEAAHGVTDHHAAPRGVLRISTPVSLGLGMLSDALPAFSERYPQVTYDLDLNDRAVDIVLEGYDVVLRIGHQDDPNLIARQIGVARGMTVASPDYLDRHGRPAYPSELAKHVCLGLPVPSTPPRWVYYDGGEPVRVDIETRLQCNSDEMELQLALGGLGVTRLPDYICGKDVAAGRLEQVLEKYQAPPRRIFAAYPHRRHLSPKVRIFVDFLAERFERGGKS